jgi:hypothetical protein
MAFLFVSRRERCAPDQFRLDGLEHGLDHGVVVAVAAPADRRDEAVLDTIRHLPRVLRATNSDFAYLTCATSQSAMKVI